jgi:hypothetical protein
MRWGRRVSSTAARCRFSDRTCPSDNLAATSVFTRHLCGTFTQPVKAAWRETLPDKSPRLDPRFGEHAAQLEHREVHGVQL